MPNQVVTMQGHENLLSVFYHASLPVYEQQNINYKLIDCGSQLRPGACQYKVLSEGPVPVQRGANLKWVGFSEDSQFISVSTAGIVSAYNLVSGWWTPILDLQAGPISQSV